MFSLRPSHLQPAIETTGFGPAKRSEGIDTTGGCSNGYTLAVWNTDNETQGG